MDNNNNNNNWRSQRNDYHDGRTRSFNDRKPPIGNWQPTVPLWEKKFCNVIGSVSWEKILDTKKYFHLYENVINWNDSAAEEAFHNAKKRFWAKINDLPCDLSPPDPDIYIDTVDWNSEIDPQLLLDLEREYVVPDEQEKEVVVIIDQDNCQYYSPDGWGDMDDNPNENKDKTATGWGCLDSSNNNNNNNSWDCKVETDDNKRSWQHWGVGHDDSMYWQTCTGQMSRYRTSRFHGDDYRRSGGVGVGSGGGRGRRRKNFVYERPYANKWSGGASKQWNPSNQPVVRTGSWMQG
ncbi:uncharacterized protein LOC124921543 [Impatiens glandulifera]|uniref:uncharacterized protein LOC124921543 n=1 Tax=Impatiens glandulifera TaxID=253017 RepID=UPI001FB0AE47|nr:uncharacterized protein LOC124921543 [Impatiens glandulifera]